MKKLTIALLILTLILTATSCSMILNKVGSEVAKGIGENLDSIIGSDLIGGINDQLSNLEGGLQDLDINGLIGNAIAGTKESDPGVTTTNERIVALFDSDESNLGADRRYFVMTGFEEDGSVDQIMGSTGFYFYYSDKAAYDAGLAEAKSAFGGVKQQDDEALYFITYAGYPNDWTSFDQIVERIDAKSNADNYSPYCELVR